MTAGADMKEMADSVDEVELASLSLPPGWWYRVALGEQRLDLVTLFRESAAAAPRWSLGRLEIQTLSGGWR